MLETPTDRITNEMSTLLRDKNIVKVVFDGKSDLKVLGGSGDNAGVCSVVDIKNCANVMTKTRNHMNIMSAKQMVGLATVAGVVLNGSGKMDCSSHFCLFGI
jgi:ribonuclease D